MLQKNLANGKSTRFSNSHTPTKAIGACKKQVGIGVAD
jgi:hypothetical protein